MICEENDQVVLYGVVHYGEDKSLCRANFDNIYANIYQHIELIDTVLVRLFLFLSFQYFVFKTEQSLAQFSVDSI